MITHARGVGGTATRRIRLAATVIPPERRQSLMKVA